MAGGEESDELSSSESSSGSEEDLRVSITVRKTHTMKPRSKCVTGIKWEAEPLRRFAGGMFTTVDGQSTKRIAHQPYCCVSYMTMIVDQCCQMKSL